MQLFAPRRGLALAALVVLAGCSLGGNDAGPAVRAEGHSGRVATVKQYAALVRQHERDIRAGAAAMDDTCRFRSAGSMADGAAADVCLTDLHRLGEQVRRLAVSLEEAATGGRDRADSERLPDKIAPQVEMTRSAASTYAQNLEALGFKAECLTTAGSKCEQLRLAVASARSELMAQLDAWTAGDERQ